MLFTKLTLCSQIRNIVLKVAMNLVFIYLFCFGFLTKTKVKTNSVLPELGINWWLIMITNMTIMQLFCDSSWKLSGAEEAERCWVWVQSKRCWLLSLWSARPVEIINNKRGKIQKSRKEEERDSELKFFNTFYDIEM